MRKRIFKILMLLSKPLLWMIPFVLTGDNALVLCIIFYLLTLTLITYVKNAEALLILSATSYDVRVAERENTLISLVTVCSCILGVACLNAAVNMLDSAQGIEYNIIPIAVAFISYLIFISCCFWNRRWYQRNVSIKVESIGAVLAYMDYWEWERQNKVFVTVAECNDIESAHAIKSRLESKGLEAITFGEGYPAYIGHVPVRVLVRRKDKEEAEKYLNG